MGKEAEPRSGGPLLKEALRDLGRTCFKALEPILLILTEFLIWVSVGSSESALVFSQIFQFNSNRGSLYFDVSLSSREFIRSAFPKIFMFQVCLLWVKTGCSRQISPMFSPGRGCLPHDADDTSHCSFLLGCKGRGYSGQIGAPRVLLWHASAALKAHRYARRNHFCMYGTRKQGKVLATKWSCRKGDCQNKSFWESLVIFQCWVWNTGSVGDGGDSRFWRMLEYGREEEDVLYLKADESVLTIGPFKIDENELERWERYHLEVKSYAARESLQNWLTQEMHRSDECSCFYCFSICTSFNKKWIERLHKRFLLYQKLHVALKGGAVNQWVSPKLIFRMSQELQSLRFKFW